GHAHAIGFNDPEPGAAQTRIAPKYTNALHLPARRAVPDGTVAGEHHDDAALIRSRDDFVVANAAARLDNASGSGIGDNVQAVAKWEECIRCHGRALQ